MYKSGEQKLTECIIDRIWCYQPHRKISWDNISDEDKEIKNEDIRELSYNGKYNYNDSYNGKYWWKIWTAKKKDMEI